ncbi:MAG: ParB/RepB/Spo0J family partition protein [Ottowia sp.]|nr:ParB/RepB/Spo0J family partition protein [Ottowia sp.]
MSNKLKDRLLGKTANLANKVAATPRQSISEQAPITMPGQLGAFRLEAQKYVEQIQSLTKALEEAQKEPFNTPSKIQELEKELEKLKGTQGKPLVLPINKLLPSELQTRKIDVTRISELAEHLAHNKLTTPVIVRPDPKNKECFEIIAGHHRVEAFKKLGRSEIDAIISPMDDDEAAKRIFFDNLMAPDLPDFEKYKGFAAIRKRTGQSYDALAKDAGISKSLVGHYFAFERLPNPAKEFLSKYPKTIGANTAQKIASLKTSDELILIALQKISIGELDQKKISTFLKVSKKEITHSDDDIQIGEDGFCTVKTRTGKIILSFKNPSEAKIWQERIVSFIKSGKTN